MSEIISKVAKIAFFVILCGILASFLATVLITLNDIIFGIEIGDLPVEISWYLIAGRKIANNFIYPNIFNACIALWFTGSATLITNYALHAIASKIAGINS